MSLPSRRLFLLAPLALAACGFRPVYGPGGNGTALQGHVTVDAPNDRNSYLLTRTLEERLGRSSSPTYALALTVVTVEDGLATDTFGNTQRFDILGTADYALRDVASGRIVTSGQVENFTGYSTTGTTVATLASQQDAQVRLMTILADQIVTRLYAADLSA